MRRSFVTRGAVPLHTEAAGAAPPDAFGPFRVLHQVGAGALGPVFRAFDPDRDRLVAVKLFRLDLPPDRMHQLVAALERLVAADVRHEAIATPIATGTDGIVVYLAQDFVSAESLDVVIRDHGPAPVADALRVGAQLAEALDFAAVVNVHHGALHPRDVLLTPDETRLTGLGVTRAIEQVGVTPPVRPPYTAPERIAGGDWDRRADIFSLAAVIHEMLWGRRVAGLGEDATRSLTDLGGGNLPALRTAFARALAEDPADRFDTALDFVVALQAAFPDVVIARPAAAADQDTLYARVLPAGGVEEAASREAETEAARDQLTTNGERREPVSTDPVAQEFRFADAELDLDATLVSPRLDPDATILIPPSTTDEGRLATDDTLVGDRLKTVPTETVLGDFELRIDDLDRHGEVELETGITGAETRSDRVSKSRPSSEAKELLRARISSPLLDAYQADEPPAGSSRAWPVAAALIVGLVSGFGGGYLVGGRQRPAPAVAAVSSVRLPPSRDASSNDRGSAQGSPPGRAGEASPVPPNLGARPSTLRPAQGRLEQSRGVIGATPVTEGDSGRLLVRSTPADATVFVDGRERGRTPVTIGELARGTHRVRISRDGYETENRRIVITPARPAESLTVTLDRRRAESAAAVTRAPAPRTPAAAGTSTGAIDVESRPVGARVFLDGSLVGTTPVAMSQVAAGDHVIRLERDGYRRWSSSIRVVSGERNRVTASLEQ